MSICYTVPSEISHDTDHSNTLMSFRNARLETLLIYAQSIYLIFAAVYVCKETLEHFLLASGEGHHHHHGDEVTDIFGYVFTVQYCSNSNPVNMLS